MNEINKSRATQLLSCYETDPIEKSGEGSKGGKVVGHTKSGKPIYDHHNHDSHNSFTHQDHEDAEVAHGKYMKKFTDNTFEERESKAHHIKQAHEHRDSAIKHNPIEKPHGIGKELTVNNQLITLHGTYPKGTKVKVAGIEGSSMWVTTEDGANHKYPIDSKIFD